MFRLEISVENGRICVELNQISDIQNMPAATASPAQSTTPQNNPTTAVAPTPALRNPTTIQQLKDVLDKQKAKILQIGEKMKTIDLG